MLTLRRPESVAVAEAFLSTEMGEGCELLNRAALQRRFPQIVSEQALGALASPHELRVESPSALPSLARWLAEEHGVAFRFGETVLRAEPPVIATSRGEVRAPGLAAACPQIGWPRPAAATFRHRSHVLAGPALTPLTHTFDPGRGYT